MHVGLAFIDLDTFKAVNDTMGHVFGDELLISYAEKFSSSLRIKDSFTARFGGDEFAIFWPMIDREGNNAPLEGFQNHVLQINEEFVLEHPEVTEVIPSFGMCAGFISTLDGYTDAKSMLEAGDKKMYEKKRVSKASRNNPTNDQVIN